jgi:hypothetical protein
VAHSSEVVHHFPLRNRTKRGYDFQKLEQTKSDIHKLTLTTLPQFPVNVSLMFIFCENRVLLCGVLVLKRNLNKFEVSLPLRRLLTSQFGNDDTNF